MTDLRNYISLIKKSGDLNTIKTHVSTKYEIEGIQLGSGVVLKWFRDNLGTFEKVIAEQIYKNSFAMVCYLHEYVMYPNLL